MAYNVAANMQFGRPVSAFIDARDNVQRNALAERQVGNQEAAQAFQQQRVTAVDKVAADQRAKEAEAADAQKLHTAMQYLNSVASNPQAFQSTAQRMLQHPDIGRILQGSGVTIEDITPQNVQELLAASGAASGQGPAPAPKQYITESGPRGALIQVDPDTGERKQIVGPDNTESPNYGNGGRARLLSPQEAKAAGFQDGTVVQELHDGRYAVIAKPDTAGGGGGGLPVGALRLVDEAKQAIGSSSQSIDLINRAVDTIKSGKVNLGIFNNAVARGRNIAGASSEASRAFTDINQTLEKLRNNYLLLAKGVQTEGDAQRAWNSEIGESVQNDNRLAIQQLGKAKGLIESMVAMQNDRIDTVYSNYGAVKPGQAPQSEPVRVASPAEAAQLPSGATFITPDGQIRKKR